MADISDYNEKLMHICFPQVVDAKRKILADVQDTADKAVVQACIRAAQAAGFTELYLIDKEFVLTALRRQRPQPISVKDIVAIHGQRIAFYCPVCGKQQKRSHKNHKEGCYCERCGQLLKGDW